MNRLAPQPMNALARWKRGRGAVQLTVRPSSGRPSDTGSSTVPAVYFGRIVGAERGTTTRSKYDATSSPDS